MFAGTPVSLFSHPSLALSVSCMISWAASSSKFEVGSSDGAASSVPVFEGADILHLFLEMSGMTSSFFSGFFKDLCRKQLVVRHEQQETEPKECESSVTGNHRLADEISTMSQPTWAKQCQACLAPLLTHWFSCLPRYWWNPYCSEILAQFRLAVLMKPISHFLLFC